MAAVWQSFAHASGATGADPVVTKPSGTVQDDLLVACGLTVNGGTFTAPAGWTQHANSLNAFRPLWWKVAGGSEPANYTFVTSDATTASIVVIVRISGATTSTPIEAAAGVAGTGALTLPTVTSGGAGRLLLQIMVKAIASNTWTPPGAPTVERHDASVGTSPTYSSASGDETVGSGATGTRVWTPSQLTQFGVGYNVAIVPAPAKTGTFTGSYDFAGSGFAGAAGPGRGSFTGGYQFAGSGFSGAAGPGRGLFTGGYQYAGSGFSGAAGPGEGVFTGGYDYTGSAFVGVAGEPSAYGFFNGGYDFTGAFTGADDEDNLIDVYGTEGGRKRFGGRK